jgi:hypothetical protein
MLDTSRCQEHFDKVLEFAKSRGLEDNLQQRLDYLDNYANGPGCTYDKAEGRDTRCVLMFDYAPHSFYFVMERRNSPDAEWKTWYNGGLILHEAGSSGAEFPVLSVRMDSSTTSYEIHT